MSNITGIPTAQVLALRTSANLATALKKQFFTSDLFSFMGNTTQREYQSATINDSVKVKIKPQLTEAVNITTFSQTELVQGDFQKASYGSIEVKLDYALVERWQYDSANLAFVTENLEADYMESAMEQMIRRMKRTINTRLRTSTFATNLGVATTDVNAKTFRQLRTAANLQGYQNKVIEVRLNPTYFEVATQIPEFQTISGYVPVAGNTAEANATISNTKFMVRGFYNIMLVSDDTFDVATPASDPKGVAYVDVSAVVPMRGLAVGDATKDTPIFDPNLGVNMLYQKESEKVNVGRVILASTEALYGFKELSGDIDQSGVIQTAPIWNILGGAAA